MRPIVAPTDFSPSASLAVCRAAQLARVHRRDLRLIHAFDKGAWKKQITDTPKGRYEGIDPIAQAQDHLDALAALLRQKYGIRCDTSLLLGPISREILTCSRLCEASLIVLGIAGEHLHWDAALGGTAMQVLQRSQQALLVVRCRENGRYGKSLIATDFSEASGRALSFARCFLAKTEQHFLHAYLVPFESRLRLAGTSDEIIARHRESAKARGLERLRQYAGESAGEFRMHVAHGHPAPVLLNACTDFEADVLVIGKRDRFSERLVGRVAHNVLHRVPCDVLLVP